MANYKEEQIRNSRRLARQALGAVALLLAFIGLLTVAGWLWSALCSVLDDSGRRQEYADRLYGMVMLDPLPFDDVQAVDPGVFKQAAIWGTVYEAQKDGGTLDQYERDPETGSAMIPKLEIDTYIANLLGPDYEITDGSFTTDQFVYQYNEEKQCYLVPVTSAVAQYTPQVARIASSGTQLRVTVGYVPTASNSTSGEISLTAPTDPVKYMDYVFTRGENRAWYLTALEESEMQVAATPTPTPTAAVSQDTQTMVESQLDSTMTDAANSAPAEDAASAEGESTPAEETPAEDGGEETASSEETPPEEGGEDTEEPAEEEPDGGEEPASSDAES